MILKGYLFDCYFIYLPLAIKLISSLLFLCHVKLTIPYLKVDNVTSLG